MTIKFKKNDNNRDFSKHKPKSNPNCSRNGFIILVAKPSIWALNSVNFLLISTPFKAALEASKPAPHNSLASKSKLKVKEMKAFNALKWLT